jgi:hypothetical protein
MLHQQLCCSACMASCVAQYVTSHRHTVRNVTQAHRRCTRRVVQANIDMKPLQLNEPSHGIKQITLHLLLKLPYRQSTMHHQIQCSNKALSAIAAGLPFTSFSLTCFFFLIWLRAPNASRPSRPAITLSSRSALSFRRLWRPVNRQYKHVTVITVTVPQQNMTWQQFCQHILAITIMRHWCPARHSTGTYQAVHPGLHGHVYCLYCLYCQ